MLCPFKWYKTGLPQKPSRTLLQTSLKSTQTSRKWASPSLSSQMGILYKTLTDKLYVSRACPLKIKLIKSMLFYPMFKTYGLFQCYVFVNPNEMSVSRKISLSKFCTSQHRCFASSSPATTDTLSETFSHTPSLQTLTKPKIDNERDKKILVTMEFRIWQ